MELGWGTHNSTYRVEIAAERPVILRVAPEPAKQFRSEREILRNEYATLPYLAPLGPLVPRTLAVDFTHEIVGRDYLFQTMLAGVHTPTGFGSYPRAEWASFFRELGTITRRVHDVDWTIHRAGRRPGTERDAFWETYGSPKAGPAATTRSLLYRAWHVGSSRLECFRLGNLDDLPETYDDLRAVLDRLH
ncbi:MAG: phosphotransferase family protein [Actinopolymorphaceae bacterium]